MTVPPSADDPDAAAGPSTPGNSSEPCRHPRDWLRKLLLSREPPPDSPLSQFPAYSDPTLRGKALAVAPMVDQSDLPFRLLCRRYGSNICWTPMIHARLFCTNSRYREKFWNWGEASWAKGAEGMPKEDRPLIAQFCGSDPQHMLEAMSAIAPFVDGVDINCGCPQGIARKGRYGAFLLEEQDHLVELVRHLAAHMSPLGVPLSVKVRILPGGIEEILRLYESLVQAGASMITVHGRNRHQKGPLTGEANWDAIKAAVEWIGDRVPVLANGGIENLDDARRCLAHTGADGIMSSEGILEYPALFTETNVSSTGMKRTGPGRVQIAREYLDLAERYPPKEGGQGNGMKCIRVHMHRFLHADLQPNPEWRDRVCSSDNTIEDLRVVVDEIEEMHRQTGHEVEGETMSWYNRHRGVNEDGVNVLEAKRAKERGFGACESDDEGYEECLGGCDALFGEGPTGDDDDGDY